jgi:hypothetical protein|tara:strand:+ start:331 stop:591 length:261 start_codon:yes stop_codon:yes gene_type:complete
MSKKVIQTHFIPPDGGTDNLAQLDQLTTKFLESHDLEGLSDPHIVEFRTASVDLIMQQQGVAGIARPGQTSIQVKRQLYRIIVLEQ